MTYATINLLHKLLEDHVDYMEDCYQDAVRMLDETCTIHEEDALEGNEDAKKEIDAAETRRLSLFQELSEAQKAMDDFKQHDWL